MLMPLIPIMTVSLVPVLLGGLGGLLGTLGELALSNPLLTGGLLLSVGVVLTVADVRTDDVDLVGYVPLLVVVVGGFALGRLVAGMIA